ncbi:hypothetical protein [Caulobacter sp. Root1455]|jgi:hypothetical protein|uniref:hypothetical protein n=1 Tax=Caulobacter sp. Root1455 TaxID=1736465 RepID=UPI0012E37108|nr:hypothetical protein [Caulobacter sp. Root1455]
MTTPKIMNAARAPPPIVVVQTLLVGVLTSPSATATFDPVLAMLSPRFAPFDIGEAGAR